MLVGGVDAYNQAFAVGFPLEHEHMFTWLGAEKAQLAMTERGMAAAQSYSLAVKFKQLYVCQGMARRNSGSLKPSTPSSSP